MPTTLLSDGRAKAAKQEGTRVVRGRAKRWDPSDSKGYSLMQAKPFIPGYPAFQVIISFAPISDTGARVHLSSAGPRDGKLRFTKSWPAVHLWAGYLFVTGRDSVRER